jgi:hypothetical protein
MQLANVCEKAIDATKTDIANDFFIFISPTASRLT